MRTVRDRPTLLQRFPNGASEQVVLPEADPRSRRRTGWRPRSSRTPNGTTSRAIVMADIAHVLWAANHGLPRLPPVAVPRQRPRARRRAAHRPRSLARRDVPDGAGGGGRASARSSTSTASRAYPKTTGNRGPARLRARRAGLGLASACARRPSPWPASCERRRPDLITGAWWKEERGHAGVHRLQPERPAQDRVRRLVRAGPARARRCRRRSRGTSWTAIDPDDAHHAAPCPAGWPRGATRGRRSTTTPQSIAPLVDRYERDLAAGIPDAPGRPSTRRCPTRRPAWPRAAPASRRSSRERGRAPRG